MISCILSTAREDYPILGQPDLHILKPTLDSLKDQTFKDWELIIVDAMYPRWRDLLEKGWGSQVKYVSPHANHRFWLDRKRWAICGQLNTGILHSEGDLLVRIDDCSEFSPDFLQRFWDGYRSGVWPMAMHIRFLNGKPARVNKEYFEEGYEAKYSLTREPDRGELLKRIYGEDGLVRDTRYPIVKSAGGRMKATPDWFYGYSSATLEAMLKINGYNELFDGDKCFPSGHLVYCLDEMKPIEEVNVGDFVLTHKGRFKPVTKIHKRWYEGELFTFQIYGGAPISLTPGHLILVRYPIPTNKKSVFGTVFRSQIGWVKARKIAEDFLKFSKFTDHRRKFRMIFTAPRTQTWTKHVNLGHHNLKITKDIARLIGYYVAEGSADRYLAFSLNEKEREYATDILKICNQELSFLKSRFLDKDHGSITTNNDSHSLSVKYHVRKEFCDSWKAWLGKDSYSKHIPYEILYGSNNEICNEFLIGLWRGDGSGYRYVTASARLAYEVQLLLGRLGKYARITKHIQKKGYGKGNVIYHVENSHATQRLHTKAITHLCLTNGEDIRGHFFYRPIRKVENSEYKGFVYHLEVEEDKTYQVHGITVHNSQEDQECGLRLWLAGYQNLFQLDVDLQVIEHEHKPIPESVITRDSGNVKCNYALYLITKMKNRWRANSQLLSQEEIDFIRAESLKPPCSPRPNFYLDDCNGELFTTWISNQNIFDLQQERLTI